MKIKIIFFLIIIFIINIKVYAQTIATVNIQLLIDNNEKYKDVLKEIDKSQQTYIENFKIKEKELSRMLSDIENSKVILDENEINLKIEKYNNDLSEFNILIEKFNLHYQNEIINIRETLLKQIIILLEKYAILNNIDLILDSTSYLIASNSLDITTFITNELKNININLNYKNFEKN